MSNLSNFWLIKQLTDRILQDGKKRTGGVFEFDNKDDSLIYYHRLEIIRDNSKHNFAVKESEKNYNFIRTFMFCPLKLPEFSLFDSLN